MKQSRRQVGQINRGRDIELSNRFEAKQRKRKRRRAAEEAGRKTSRRHKKH